MTSNVNQLVELVTHDKRVRELDTDRRQVRAVLTAAGRVLGRLKLPTALETLAALTRRGARA